MFLKKYPPSPAQKKIRWPPQLEIAGEVPGRVMSRTIFSYQDIYLELAVKSSNIHSRNWFWFQLYYINI